MHNNESILERAFNNNSQMPKINKSLSRVIPIGVKHIICKHDLNSMKISEEHIDSIVRLDLNKRVADEVLKFATLEKREYPENIEFELSVNVIEERKDNDHPNYNKTNLLLLINSLLENPHSPDVRMNAAIIKRKIIDEEILID